MLAMKMAEWTNVGNGYATSYADQFEGGIAERAGSLCSFDGVAGD
jgi:hypothetical protein